MSVGFSKVISSPEKQKLNYGPVSSVLVTISAFFGGQLFAGVAIGLVPAILLGWKESQVSAWINSGLLPQMIIVSLAGVISLLIIGYFLKRRGNTFTQLGVDKPKAAALWQAGLALLVYLGSYLVLLAVIKTLIPNLDINQQQDLGFSVGQAQNIWLLIFGLVIVPPIVEEIVMRGFLFSGLRTKYDFKVAALITSVLFASAHLPEAKQGLLWVGAIDTFVLSLVLCYLREKTNSLWPSIFLHMMKNTLALIALVSAGQ